MVLAAAATCVSAAAPLWAQAPSRIVVDVVDRATGEPVSRAAVTLGTSARAATDAQGRATVLIENAEVTDVAWRLEVRRLGYAPFDSVVGGRALRSGNLRVQLEPLTNELSPLVISADVACPSGFGRIASPRALAARLLNSVEPVVRPLNAVPDGAWQVTETERVLAADGTVLERYVEEQRGDSVPTLRGLPPDSLLALGFVWEDAGAWSYEVPHPNLLGADLFQRRHCFQVGESVSGDGLQELRFVPAQDEDAIQLAGRLVFAHRPTRLLRFELSYPGAPREARGTEAEAVVHFVAGDDQRVSIRRWVQTIPVLASEFVVEPSRAKPLPIQVNARVVEREVRIEEADSTQHQALHERRAVVDCSGLTLPECLRSGNLRWDHRMPSARTAAAAYWAEACQRGPLPLWSDQPVPPVSFGSERLPAGWPTRELTDALYESATEADLAAPQRRQYDAVMQLEACTRLLQAVDADPFLRVEGLSPDAMRTRACSVGEGLLCLQLAADDARWAVLACELEVYDACVGLQPDSTRPQRRALARLAEGRSLRAATQRELRELLATARAAIPRLQVLEGENGFLLRVPTDRAERLEAEPLAPDLRDLLDALGRVLAEHRGVTLTMFVHADFVPVDHGLRRSIAFSREQRAYEHRLDAVRTVLEEAGMRARDIRGERVSIAEPLASNATAVGRQANRRLELVITRN